MGFCKVHQLDMNGFCNRFDAPCIKKNCRFFGVKTNADRIRAMSDEELSEFLWGFDLQEMAREGFGFITRRKVIEWLKMPVED